MGDCDRLGLGLWGVPGQGNGRVDYRGEDGLTSAGGSMRAGVGGALT